VTAQAPSPAAPAAVEARPVSVARQRTLLVGLASTLALAAAVSLGIGAVALPAESVLRVIGETLGLLPSASDDAVRDIILQIRLPRIVLATVAGAGLAVAGTVFQGLFRNPMADPYIIGVSAGAALGATVGIVFGLTFSVVGQSAVTLMAFAGALVVTLVVYRLGWHRGDVVVEQLLLAGVAVSAFLAGIISTLQLIGGASLQNVLFWLMGGFSGRGWEHLALAVPYIAVGYVVAWVFARDLNLLVLGDETARSLGVAVGRARIALTAAGALMAAAVVATSGLIGFVGLVVPHLMRLATGPDHRQLLPVAALAGAITMLLADTVARTLAAPMEIPVGIVTAALGAPFFLYLLRKHRKRTFWS
jgi:iron complex transport system permease protein